MWLPLCSRLQPCACQRSHRGRPALSSAFKGTENWPRVRSFPCPGRGEKKINYYIKQRLYYLVHMLWFTPISSSEQGIVCLQLFQALKIPLYSLCSQLNEDHLRNISEMMSFGLSLFPSGSLTAGLDPPWVGHNMHTVSELLRWKLWPASVHQTNACSCYHPRLFWIHPEFIEHLCARRYARRFYFACVRFSLTTNCSASLHSAGRLVLDSPRDITPSGVLAAGCAGLWELIVKFSRILCALFRYSHYLKVII